MPVHNVKAIEEEKILLQDPNIFRWCIQGTTNISPTEFRCVYCSQSNGFLKLFNLFRDSEQP